MIAGRVIMLSRDQGLASIAGQFVGRGQPLTRFSSPAEVPDWLRPPTGVVVLDYPQPARVIVFRQLRQRYLGPVLAVLDPSEGSSGLPTDHGRIGTLHRPFTGEELRASLDALVGSRDSLREPKSHSPTAQPVGTEPGPTGPLDVSEVFAATPASVRARHVATGPAAPPWVTPRLPESSTRPARAVGVPAAEVPARRVVAARRRAAMWRMMGPTARRRMSGLALCLAATAALVLAVTLSGGGCGSTGCGNVASATESDLAGAPPAGHVPATAQPGPRPATGSGGKGTSTRNPGGATAADPPPGPGTVIPIASGVGDLLSGTSSSSGGAPLLVPGAPGSTSSGGTSSGGTSGGGSSGGGAPSPTTRPTATTSAPAPVTTSPPATTAPPTTTAPPPTDPPTTAPPPTDPPTTTAPPPTDPPTTAPPPTDPPTTTPPPTEPPTTAGTTSPA